MSVRKTPVIIQGVEHWLCPGCDTIKLPVEFYVSRHSANGLFSYCKICQNNVAKKYQKERAATRKKEQAELQRLRKVVAKKHG